MRFVIYLVELHVTLGGKQQGASRSPFWIKVVGVLLVCLSVSIMSNIEQHVSKQ